jgi:hypothetical protein
LSFAGGWASDGCTARSAVSAAAPASVASIRFFDRALSMTIGPPGIVKPLLGMRQGAVERVTMASLSLICRAAHVCDVGSRQFKRRGEPRLDFGEEYDCGLAAHSPRGLAPQRRNHDKSGLPDEREILTVLKLTKVNSLLRPRD